MAKYNANMTDKQWAKVQTLLKKEKRGKLLANMASERELINAVLYLNKTGCQWRLLPNDFPPYTAVWSFYRRTVKSGLWHKINAALVKKPQSSCGKYPRYHGRR